MDTTNQDLVNAWIYMDEKDPVINGKVAGYNDPAAGTPGILILNKRTRKSCTSW